MDQLAHVSPEDIFRLAILRSNFSVPVLAKRLKWSESFLRRVISSEKYYPSFVDIPMFCAAVGNTLVIEWQLARVSIEPQEEPSVTPDFLREQVLELSTEFGDVANKIKEALSDNHVSKAESKGILREVLELVNVAATLAGILREADKKVARNG